MKFTYDGKQYRIEFKRERKQIRSGWDKVKQEPVYRPSRYVYTTVNILEDVPDAIPGRIHRTFTVGCHHRDNFSLETGRVASLKMVSMGNSLSKDFKRALWESYMGRCRTQVANP